MMIMIHVSFIYTSIKAKKTQRYSLVRCPQYRNNKNNIKHGHKAENEKKKKAHLLYSCLDTSSIICLRFVH